MLPIPWWFGLYNIGRDLKNLSLTSHVHWWLATCNCMQLLWLTHAWPMIITHIYIHMHVLFLNICLSVCVHLCASRSISIYILYIRLSVCSSCLTFPLSFLSYFPIFYLSIFLCSFYTLFNSSLMVEEKAGLSGYLFRGRRVIYLPQTSSNSNSNGACLRIWCFCQLGWFFHWNHRRSVNQNERHVVTQALP